MLTSNSPINRNILICMHNGHSACRPNTSIHNSRISHSLGDNIILFLPVEHRSWNIGWKTHKFPPPPQIIWKFFVKHIFVSLSLNLSVCLSVCLQVYGGAKCRQFCLQSLGTKGNLHTQPTLYNNEPVPQVLKQVLYYMIQVLLVPWVVQATVV